MAQSIPVNYPVFCSAWCKVEVLSELDSDLHVNSLTAIICGGGGGSVKSGVPNRISVLALRSTKNLKPELGLVHETDTSPDVASCLAVDSYSKFVSVGFGNRVALYSLVPGGLLKLSQFSPDNALKGPTVNSLAFRPGIADSNLEAKCDIYILSAGEDQSLKIWHLKIRNLEFEQLCKKIEGSSKDQVAKVEHANFTLDVLKAIAKSSQNKPQTAQFESLEDTDIVEVNLVAQLNGHSAEICCVRWHPDALSNLVLSSSKDGTCRLWNWKLHSEMAVLSSATGLPSSSLKPKTECRACAFSPSGKEIYFVQKTVGHGTYLSQWALNVDNGEVPLATCTPKKAKLVSKVPVTQLAMHCDGTKLAIGDVDGRVFIYSIPRLSMARVYAAHDLPITCLSFASDMCGGILKQYNLVAGSFDNKRLSLLSSQGNMLLVLFGVLHAMISFLWACFKVFAKISPLVFAAYFAYRAFQLERFYM